MSPIRVAVFNFCIEELRWKFCRGSENLVVVCFYNGAASGILDESILTVSIVFPVSFIFVLFLP